MVHPDQNFGEGMAACAIASVFFGSMFVPLKPFETHDGFFVQLMMCVGIFIVGLIVQIIRNFPPFYPLAMLGGFLWATGNVTAIPIINRIGMGVGILIWCFNNMLFGWASGRFGWFGITPQLPKSDLLNALGLALSLISAIMFAFVKTNNPSVNGTEKKDTDEEPLLPNEDDEETVRPPRNSSAAFGQRVKNYLCADKEKTFAITLALCAGVFYGLTFAPVYVILDTYPGVSQEGLDYVFAHYTGILLTSVLYFICYCAYTQNKPVINPKTALPAIFAGVLWAIAQSAWFVANQNLSEAVSFPIITRFPGAIAALWGIVLFKEIRGRKNLQFLTWAILITVVGGVLSGLSKIIST